MRGIDFSNPETENNSFGKRISFSYVPFEFRGNAKEYFKIWIVNVFLTLITLGIYSAWAKVRSKRYIYANTYLKESNFEYNANPIRILIGRLIVALFFALFYINFKILHNQKVATVIAAIFLLLLPWLIRQAIAFKLKVTTYRNLQFHFLAKARTLYWFFIKSLLIIAASIAFILFLIAKFPDQSYTFYILLFSFFLFIFVIAEIIKNYWSLIINNSTYGNTRFLFETSKKDILVIFVKMFLWTILFALFLIVAKATFSSLLYMVSSHVSNKKITLILVYIMIITIYLIQIGFFKGLSDGYFSNFLRNHTKLASLPLKGEISPFILGVISATNALAIFFSIGLLYPWAKMRYLKYKLSHTYIKNIDFEQFESRFQSLPYTLGEEALDFFDIDIGL